jgi:chaperonin GroEL (HSP60 family)
MSHKHLLFRSEAREKILKGATAIADVIRVTLGPKSKCVLIEKRWGKPIVCNDGVTIAKEFELRVASIAMSESFRSNVRRTSMSLATPRTPRTRLAARSAASRPG